MNDATFTGRSCSLAHFETENLSFRSFARKHMFCKCVAKFRGQISNVCFCLEASSMKVQFLNFRFQGFRSRLALIRWSKSFKYFSKFCYESSLLLLSFFVKCRFKLRKSCHRCFFSRHSSQAISSQSQHHIFH